MSITIEVPFTFENLYKKHLKYFDIGDWNDHYSPYRRNLDTQFYNKEFDWVEIVEDHIDDERWLYYIIFKYEDKFYYVEYREGSLGYGVNFDYDTLKEVTPKTKEVVYYE